MRFQINYTFNSTPQEINLLLELFDKFIAEAYAAAIPSDKVVNTILALKNLKDQLSKQ